MHIKNHHLIAETPTTIEFRRSPNQGKGTIVPKYLVIHYTGASSADSAINWFLNPTAKASAHLVIGRDGTITQMVAFNRKAWHAGISRWDGLGDLNTHAIGIELANAGTLKKVGQRWQSRWGHPISEDDVLIARHKLDEEAAAWQTFPEVQLTAALHAATVLCRRYGLREVVGHEDIAPRRKRDPGPAFPMDAFAAAAVGRTDEPAATHRTTTRLNIRSGPGTEHAPLAISPLDTGTDLEILDRAGVWTLVDVPPPVRGNADISGWVHGRYIERV